MLRGGLVLLALVAPVAALAADNVRTSASVFVEREFAQPNGERRIRLEPVQQVKPGENLIYIVEYRNTGSAPVQGFTVTNPLPRTIRLAQTSDSSEQVSIDGGRSWGQLSVLRVYQPRVGWRPAYPDDVTHLRWRVDDRLMQGESRRIAFRATVR